jgi:hypothetical protein
MENSPNRIKTKQGWRSFAEARDFARSMGLKSHEQWKKWAWGRLPGHEMPRPKDIPADPQGCMAYKGEWVDWWDWLGSKKPAWWKADPIPFEEARPLVVQQGFQTMIEYVAWLRGHRPDLPKPPPGMPRYPSKVASYRGLYQGSAHFLGMGRCACPPFEEFRAFVVSLKIKSSREYAAWIRGKRPDLPPPPARAIWSPYTTNQYRAEWKGWPYFLGLPAKLHDHLPFAQARALVRQMKFSGKFEFRAWFAGQLKDRPPPAAGIPRTPEHSYKKDWRGWLDWLGREATAGRGRGKKFRSFEEARAFVRGLRFGSSTQYVRWALGKAPELPPRPPDIPAVPSIIYASSWQGWNDWIGGKTRKDEIEMLALTAARRAIGKFGFKTKEEYSSWWKLTRPARLPRDPERVYGDNFTWTGFLCSDPRYAASADRFSEDRVFVRSLGLKTGLEFKVWISGKRPDLPRPERLKVRIPWRLPCWSGWDDYLGRPATSTQRTRSYRGRLRKNWRTFGEARRFVRGLGLRSVNAWAGYCVGKLPELAPKPPDIPSAPYLVYASEFVTWADWLGADIRRCRKGPICPATDQNAPGEHGAEVAPEATKTGERLVAAGG